MQEPENETQVSAVNEPGAQKSVGHKSPLIPPIFSSLDVKEA